jgi:hypothetical protein
MENFKIFIAVTLQSCISFTFLSSGVTPRLLAAYGFGGFTAWYWHRWLTLKLASVSQSPHFRSCFRALQGLPFTGSYLWTIHTCINYCSLHESCLNAHADCMCASMQCKLGHVACLMCRDKLKATGKCHVCGIVTGGYRRCHAVECLVESIRFPCPNAAYGCTARTTYYDQHCHHQTCPHGPCHCPGEACGFVGTISMLVDHFKAVHGTWPCATQGFK